MPRIKKEPDYFANFTKAVQLFKEIPSYLIEQYNFKETHPDFVIVDEKNWNIYKTEYNQKLLSELAIKRITWIKENINEKDFRKFGIKFVDENNVTLNFDKFPVTFLNKLNEIK